MESTSNQAPSPVSPVLSHGCLDLKDEALPLPPGLCSVLLRAQHGQSPFSTINLVSNSQSSEPSNTSGQIRLLLVINLGFQKKPVLLSNHLPNR